MPYHTNSVEDMKKKIDSKKEEKERKPRKKTQKELFKKDDKLSPAMLKKLKEHSKMHKGGMGSKHIRKMIIFIKEGNSFNKAHDLTVEFEKKKKKK